MPDAALPPRRNGLDRVAGISWRARLVKTLLRLIRRRRVYASVDGLMAGIAQTRRSGPARPTAAMFGAMDIALEQVLGRDVYTLRPRSGSSGLVVLYLHGGAYCRPITPHHWSLLQWFVSEHGYSVVVPLYPLAPECECRDTVPFVRRVHALAIQRYGAVDAFVGDSAGGGLCLALCQDLRKKGQPLPRRISLITPWVELSLTHEDIAGTEPRDPMLGIIGAQEAGRLYAGSLGTEHPWASPLRADLRGLPPMQLLAATDDILHHDVLAFASKARASGCSVDLHVEPGMVHAWPLLPVPEARRARDMMAKFIKG